jgi:hypothetical protein
MNVSQELLPCGIQNAMFTSVLDIRKQSIVLYLVMLLKMEKRDVVLLTSSLVVIPQRLLITTDQSCRIQE